MQSSSIIHLQTRDTQRTIAPPCSLALPHLGGGGNNTHASSAHQARAITPAILTKVVAPRVPDPQAFPVTPNWFCEPLCAHLHYTTIRVVESSQQRLQPTLTSPQTPHKTDPSRVLIPPLVTHSQQTRITIYPPSDPQQASSLLVFTSIAFCLAPASLLASIAFSLPRPLCRCRALDYLLITSPLDLSFALLASQPHPHPNIRLGAVRMGVVSMGLVYCLQLDLILASLSNLSRAPLTLLARQDHTCIIHFTSPHLASSPFSFLLSPSLGTQHLFIDRRRMEPATHGWPFMRYAPVRNRRIHASMFHCAPTQFYHRMIPCGPLQTSGLRQKGGI